MGAFFTPLIASPFLRNTDCNNLLQHMENATELGLKFKLEYGKYGITIYLLEILLQAQSFWIQIASHSKRFFNTMRFLDFRYRSNSSINFVVHAPMQKTKHLGKRRRRRIGNFKSAIKWKKILRYIIGKHSNSDTDGNIVMFLGRDSGICSRGKLLLTWKLDFFKGWILRLCIFNCKNWWSWLYVGNRCCNYRCNILGNFC